MHHPTPNMASERISVSGSVGHSMFGLKTKCGVILLSVSVFAVTNFFAIDEAKADEGGVSFWLPGTYGSLAAVPQQPGWSLGTVYYHTSVSASGNVAAAREATVGRFNPTVNVDLNVKLHANVDLVLVNPSYVFATPVLGGQ